MSDDDELDPAEELARLNRRGLFRNAQRASATWIAIATFLLVGGVIAGGGIVLGVVFGLASRFWTYACLAAGGAAAAAVATYVRNRIEPKHPDDE